jgi:alanine racemase
MAAVKANAYGHGLLNIARSLSQADALAVARLSEAVILRHAGIDQDIVVLGGFLDRDELELSLKHNCTLVVHSEYQVGLLQEASATPGRIWLKIDTGMNRLGVSVDSVKALLARLRHCDCGHQLGLMTHLANADDVDDPMSDTQLQRFVELADDFEGDVSVANSAALLGWGAKINAAGMWNNSGNQWIRPGISLYGISPLRGRTAKDFNLQPVMQFESVLIAVKPVRKGDCVGYGGHWVAERDSVLGIVAAGYGDGYSRFLPSGTPLLLNGRRVPLAGVVSMDMCAVDLGPDASDRIGDRVVLWGSDLPVEEIALHAQTTAYPLVCGVTDREGRLQ